MHPEAVSFFKEVLSGLKARIYYFRWCYLIVLSQYVLLFLVHVYVYSIGMMPPEYGASGVLATGGLAFLGYLFYRKILTWRSV